MYKMTLNLAVNGENKLDLSAFEHLSGICKLDETTYPHYYVSAQIAHDCVPLRRTVIKKMWDEKTMALENFAYTPKYRQIQSYIIDKIDLGELAAGDKIPSETELTSMFGVSRVTANAAIKELATRGIIQRVRGVGSFICDAKQPPVIDPMCFTGQIKINTQGRPLGQKKHTCISIKKIQVSENVREKLQLKYGQEVYEVVRQMHSGNLVDELDYSYVPASLLGAEPIRPEEVEANYFHEYLQKRLYTKPKYIKFFIRKENAFPIDEKLLQLQPEDTLLIWDIIVYDEHETPLGLTTSISKRAINSAFLTFEL